MKTFLCKEIVLNTDTQNPLESTSESTNENLEAEKKETKSTKSNSELMAEFFLSIRMWIKNRSDSFLAGCPLKLLPVIHPGAEYFLVAHT